MQEIGIIQFVQIQRNPMKIWTEEDRIYRTDPLLRVSQLRLTQEGIIGITEQGGEIIDAHHIQHAESRNRGGNGISIGFLQNYEKMRRRFGSHIQDGFAAENIIVDAAVDLSLFTSASRFFIHNRVSDIRIELKEVVPAPPCREFSIFCLQVPQCKEEIQSALQFLDNGMRGYYAEILSDSENVIVQAGDRLIVA